MNTPTAGSASCLPELRLALSYHRHQLQHFLDKWVQQQDGILDEVIRGHILERPCSNMGPAHHTSTHALTEVAGDQTSGISSDSDVDDMIPHELTDRDDVMARSETNGCHAFASESSAAKLRELASSGMKLHSSFINTPEQHQKFRDTFSVATDPDSPDSPDLIGKSDHRSSTNSGHRSSTNSKSMHSILGINNVAQNRSAMVRQSMSLIKMTSTLHDDSSRASLLAEIVMSTKFESVCAAVILANAGVMGIAADYDMKHLNEPDHAVLAQLEFVFVIFYAVEVFLRIAVYGLREYFCESGWKWNVFDVALTVMAAFDLLQEAFSPTGDVGGQNLSFLRMLRLFKMLRLLRMIRLMKMFRELRLILYSMLGSMQAMLWASLLVLIISYMAGICLLQGCTTYLEDNEADDESQRMIEQYWGSIGQAILSLFMATTGGEDWIRIAAPLQEVGWAFHAVFITYVAFFTLVVMNTVTSLFVDSMVENSSRDQQAIIQTELEKKDMYVNRLQTFFDEIDEDGNGIVSYAEFCRHAHDPVLRAFAASLDIDIDNSKLFFKILSDDGCKEVDVETFVVGCIRLRGLARSMDLIDLIHTTKHKAQEQERYLKEILHDIHKLRDELHVQSRSSSKEIKMETCDI